MKFDRPAISRSRVETDTHTAQEYARITRERVAYLDGAERAERVADCTCPMCYKRSRVGGATCCEAPCGICRETIRSGSTCVDVVCRACAKRAGLCRVCGGDSEMKMRRKGWNLSKPDTGELPGEVGDGQ